MSAWEAAEGGFWRISLMRRSELTVCESRRTIIRQIKKTACAPPFL